MTEVEQGAFNAVAVAISEGSQPLHETTAAILKLKTVAASLDEIQEDVPVTRDAREQSIPRELATELFKLPLPNEWISMNKEKLAAFLLSKLTWPEFLCTVERIIIHGRQLNGDEGPPEPQDILLWCKAFHRWTQETVRK